MKKFLFLTLLLSAIGMKGWAEKYPNVLYAVGSATSTNWDIGAASKLYKYADSNKYQGFVSFNSSEGELKFLCQDNWGDMWGAPSADVEVSDAGTISISYHAYHDGGIDDYKFKPTFATGLYLVTIDATNEGYETVTFKQWKNSTDVYKIGNAAQLSAFANCINNFNQSVNAKLTDNIDFDGVTDFPGIGSLTYPFAGEIDGDFHIISNLSMSDTREGVGLVNRATAGATIKNLTIASNCSFSGSKAVGAFVGGVDNNSGVVTFLNCGNEGSVTSTGQNAGGILGCNFNGNIAIHMTNCYNTGSITSGSEGGALSGWVSENKQILNCYNSGTLTNCAGMLRGNASGTIANCWSTSSATAGDNCINANTILPDDTNLQNGKVFTALFGYTNADLAVDGSVWRMDYTGTAHPVLYGNTIAMREDCQNTLPSENMTGMSVKLYRTLTKDTWNSICLPFDLDASSISAIFGEGTKVAAFTSVNGVNNDNLHFEETTSISAKTPYLIYPANNRDIDTPIVLSGITIQVGPQTVSHSPFNFTGIYTPTSITGKYFIASGNTIKQSTGGNLKGFRAYIEAPAAEARTLTFDFFDDVTTGVKDAKHLMNSGLLTTDNVYDLQGRRIANPTKGLYVVNGKKVVIK